LPLNKLENFIKNIDGRTLYVNPADLNATDSITNEGTSLTEPFRSLQRALIESARFSYVRGENNDLIEKTTIILYPGEHTIDNRPGYGIRVDNNDAAVAVSPTGQEVAPSSVFNLTSDTNFDIESSSNILWHFNSIYGGVVVPRGTSIVGMDLRKTKIRPKYVPNPTDPSVPSSAIFRVTGTCYFWQFTIFDGAETGFVFTDPKDFSENNQSRPTFSHNKLTAFEYADGVNPAIANGFELTDLQMYYSKLSNAYNLASGRDIKEKYPSDPGGFAPMLPEFQIVGAFATDPLRIASLISGDGFTPDAVVTVDTIIENNLAVGTPIKIRGVAIADYNISTKVTSIISPTRFTYLLSLVRPELPARPSVSSATITVETDTVTGASPYIFNVSMRSVWGINGMHADGAKATGFRSMVVAQFTAISLQKDDRSFVKYNDQARRYDGIDVSTPVRGAELASGSSSTNSARVYHLDPRAIYRPGWDTTHIKMSNDAVIQIVSVFAIGFNQHFAALSGADASITNSNSNFGQFALLSGGFKNKAFDKDDRGFVTQIVTPNTAYNQSEDDISNIGWVNIDFNLTNSQALPGQIYLLGYSNKEERPPYINQGFRLGANYTEVLYQPLINGTVTSASVCMVDNLIEGSSRVAIGNNVARKIYPVIAGPGQGPTSGSTLTLPFHGLLNGETIRIFSGTGDLPENIDAATLYYANVVDEENIRISTSQSNALNDLFLDIYGGTELRIESRVNDKKPGEAGHPIQYDDVANNWFIHTGDSQTLGSDLYRYIRANSSSTEGFDFVTYYQREGDNRSLDDKIYRLRYVIPKETVNAKPPTPGYVIQESSATGARDNDDFILSDISFADYEYDRNPRYIVDCNFISISSEISVRSEIPHQLFVGDKINIINVTSTSNPDAVGGRGYNGEFLVTRIVDARNFYYSSTDVNGFSRNLVGDVFTNDTNDRNILLPRFQRKDNQVNAFVYRVEEISPFTETVRDGIYHLFCVNGSNQVTETFTDRFYNQPIENLYPQLDTDNTNNNVESSTTFADRSPLGSVVIDSLQSSITRETIDKLSKSSATNLIKDVTVGATNTILEFEREHKFNGLYSYTTLNGGSGYNNGTYYNVKLFSGATWKGASAEIEIISGQVNKLTIMDPGSGYTSGETLSVDQTGLGNGVGATITINSKDIESSEGIILQLTGGGLTTPDSYAPIAFVTSTTTVSIPNDSIESGISVNRMYALPTDIGASVTSYTFNSTTGTSRFTTTTSRGFGLQRGNSFVTFDSSGTPLGKYYVSAVPSPHIIESTTNVNLNSVDLIGKCGYEDNDANTGSSGENIGIRGTSPFDLGVFYLNQSAGTGNVLTLAAQNGGVSGNVAQKLPLGRYLQIGSEIIRVASTDFGGADLNKATVIRGALGTNIINHPQYSKVRAINPIAIELRRPSILRASGHTFEYLGYGPGNYSTALPQLQVEQLPDEEVYLVQAQELSCGQVVYTGMSDSGDFYIGNTKYSATSGTQTTFDVPIPTVAGQNASSNNVVFDEVIVNQRLFVAGGETNEVLSQFDGPVKFTQSVNIENDLGVTGNSSLNTVDILSTNNANSVINGGALTIRGGAAIAKDLRIGGKVFISDNVNAEGNINADGNINSDGNVNADGNINAGGNLTADGDLIVDGDISTDGSISAEGNISLDGTITVGGRIDAELSITTKGNLNAEGNVNVDGDLNASTIRTKSPNTAISIFENQNTGLLSVGGEPGKVVFNTTVDATGEGGDLITNADAGVVIEGGLVVRGTLLAGEVKANGLGKPGTIIMWGGSTDNVPEGYLICNGALYNKNTYNKLFDAIGTIHGGNGNPNFRVPDLRNRFIVGTGSLYDSGDRGGNNNVTLTEAQLASHTHTINNKNLSHSHPLDESSTANDNTPIEVGGSTTTNGSHNHTASSNNNGTHNHTVTDPTHSHTGSDGAVVLGGQSGFPNLGDPFPFSQSLRQVQIGTLIAANSTGISLVDNGLHNHTITVNTVNSGHSHDILTSGTANHNHDLTGDTSSALGNHNHTAQTTGLSEAHENRPPYYALVYLIQSK
jgi:microcystin-dependent protein